MNAPRSNNLPGIVSVGVAARAACNLAVCVLRALAAGIAGARHYIAALMGVVVGLSGMWICSYLFFNGEQWMQLPAFFTGTMLLVLGIMIFNRALENTNPPRSYR